MARAGTRVARLQRHLKPESQRTRIVTADAWRWPEDAKAALAAACAAGNPERMAALVEAHGGERPTLGGSGWR